MDLEIINKKIEIINWLESTEDSALIEKILELTKAEDSDWWGKISELEKKSIEEGISDANQGKLKPNSEAKKIYGKWL